MRGLERKLLQQAPTRRCFVSWLFLINFTLLQTLLALPNSRSRKDVSLTLARTLKKKKATEAPLLSVSVHLCQELGSTPKQVGKSKTVIRANCGKRVQSHRNTTQQLQRESTKFPVQQDHFIYLLHKISKMEDEMCEEEAQMMLPFMLVVCAADAKI